MTPETILYRQVHESWIKNSRPTSQAFKPTPKDNNRLSVHYGAMLTAEEAWLYYTKQLQLDSGGVVAVTVAECNFLDLPVEPNAVSLAKSDSIRHAEINFESFSGNTLKKKARQLREFAMQRGWLYQPKQ